MFFNCRRPGSNRYERLVPQDFKSCASASSATPAKCRWHIPQTTRMGLEPTTSAVTGRRSNQLSHRAILMYLQNCIQSIHSSLSTSPSVSRTSWLSPRPISDSQLHTLLCFHLCPIYLVVFKGSYYLRMGYLILRGASRLDAFSVYPFPTWLPGHAPGGTTGTPEVSPSRSSRTKDSSSQISYAHAG